MVRDLLSQAVIQRGHEALGVAPVSIQAVISAARTFRPNLVISDYQMPDCPGDELVWSLRQDPSLGGVPVVVFTASRDPEALQAFIRLGIHGLVFKGIGLQELMAKVASIV